MRIPEDFDKYKSDGRVIDLDLNDPSMALSDKPGEKTTSVQLLEWLRSNGWAVSTEHRGPMRIGGKTADQDEAVASLESMLLDEFVHTQQGCIY